MSRCPELARIDNTSIPINLNGHTVSSQTTGDQPAYNELMFNDNPPKGVDIIPFIFFAVVASRVIAILSGINYPSSKGHQRHK